MKSKHSPWSTIVESISKVAPFLATALGGPAGGVIASTLSHVFFGHSKAGVADLFEAIVNQGISEQQKLELARLDKEYQAQVKRLALDEFSMLASAQQDAREKEVKTKDGFVKILSMIIVTGFFSMATTFLCFPVPEDRWLSEHVLYILGDCFIGVCTYYLGRWRVDKTDKR